jgi:hypothetical protein
MIEAGRASLTRDTPDLAQMFALTLRVAGIVPSK